VDYSLADKVAMEVILQVLGHTGLKQVLSLEIYMMVLDVNHILYPHVHITLMVLIQLAHQPLPAHLNVLQLVKNHTILLIALIYILENHHTLSHQMLHKSNKKSLPMVQLKLHLQFMKIS